MRILGVDPGSRVTGYGVIESGEAGRWRAVRHGAVRVPRALPFFERLLRIHRAFQEVLDATAVDEVAIEGIFHAANARTALQLGHARGVVLIAALERELPVHEYSPAEVKKAVVGFGRAEKSQVQTMVERLLATDGPVRPHDAADALAVAVCHGHSLAFRRLVPSSGGRSR